jgi:uncharacterized cupin superfamily protein
MDGTMCGNGLLGYFAGARLGRSDRSAGARPCGGCVALSPGKCAGFPAQGLAHHLVNRTDSNVTYLEIGDRTPGDEGSYPADDIKAVLGPDGKWQFTHKDRRKY